MNCEECEALIYLSGELSEQENAKLEAHLAGCSSCRELKSSMDLQAEIIRKASAYHSVPVDSAGLTNRIMNRVMPPEGRVKRAALPEWVRWLRYSFAAVGICIVLFFYSEWTRYSYEQMDQPGLQTGEASLATPGLKKLKEERMQSSFSVYRLLKQKKATQ